MEIIKKEKNNTVDIILHPKLGDAILSQPAILCLNQLNQKYNKNIKIKVISTFPNLAKVLSALDIYNSKQMNLSEKAKTFVLPSDVAFYLATSSKNLGYKAKNTYGELNSFKTYIKYTQETPYLKVENTKDLFSTELYNFLREKFSFSTKTISIFGICIDLGFSEQQIIETFNFNPELLSAKKEFSNWIPPLEENSYIVFCMEAANNNKVDLCRRWDETNYIEIAEKIYDNYGIEVVFIGVDTRFKIPSKPYFKDLRKKLDIAKLAILMKFSLGYIGNDTGPLHLNNLMQKLSIGMYFNEVFTRNFSPIFPQLNKVILKPKNVEEVFSQVKFLLG